MSDGMVGLTVLLSRLECTRPMLLHRSYTRLTSAPSGQSDWLEKRVSFQTTPYSWCSEAAFNGNFHSRCQAMGRWRRFEGNTAAPFPAKGNVLHNPASNRGFGTHMQQDLPFPRKFGEVSAPTALPITFKTYHEQKDISMSTFP